MRKLLILALLCAALPAAAQDTATPTETPTETPTATGTPTVTPTPTETPDPLLPHEPATLSHIQGVSLHARSLQMEPGGPVEMDGRGVVVGVAEDGTVVSERSFDLTRADFRITVNDCRVTLGLTAAQMGSRVMGAALLDCYRTMAEARLIPLGTPSPVPPTATPTEAPATPTPEALP